ncbi:MAG: hypothetical protein F4Y62_21670 [Rhodospirillaceae bacterium]|nr:hypothetical protein [Rhodospirillaceae bacterium]
MSGRGRVSGEGVPAAFHHRHDGDGIMSAAFAIPRNTASTFLTHFFGSGLSDDTYVVERFKAMVDGDIRRCADWQPAAKTGRRKTKDATVTRKAVQDLRPARTEIIVCTGLKTRGGVQIWGDIACGLFHDRKQKG